MRKQILKGDRKYTFSDYFELSDSTEEIVKELGYSFSQQAIHLPKSKNYNPEDIRKLRDTFYIILPRITINSEIARREFLIAPILIEVAKITDSRINVEHPLEINDKLSGSLDYLIRATQELIVIEAKKGDLDKGFSQLSAGLIALDKYEEEYTGKALYGAITVGSVWGFGVLDRDRKHIIKDINMYTIPVNTEEIFSILAGILTSEL
uniref:Type I restriction enzyme R protein N terminus (HSDR_N) n=1 Tax=Candidatus Kentrum sp. MB TaxID=2138164 RepID=A0A450XHI4_9GAMM|nr:MAG: hypothetical protein BECKMB1821G_GA0114241_100210 [Candidatus Kentron sp. MB]VFK28762.1 MAG: hypothetical protein BECKMB1821I_GA0114274_100711 [Candidatus Kentron sp. MB]VFK74081.1 MAG: hypothetical protein BECKMB1821H_GA0114242_100110 [Candidatus Kentron sp. MB]